MYDRFLVPYYFFWPIALISFVSVFFLPTDTQVILNEKYDGNITNYPNNNLSDLSLYKNQNGKNITEICKNFLKDINNQKEIYLVNKLNLAIKIIVFILFGLTVLNIGFVICMVEGGGCYDDDIGGFCQTWEQTFSYNSYEEDDLGTQGFWVFSIFIVICLGIIFLCIFSICFSLKIKDKMSLYCSFQLDEDEDYYIDLWNVAKVFLVIIISVYSIEILLCVYSILFGIKQRIKERRKKMNKNNLDSKNNSDNKNYLNI